MDQDYTDRVVEAAEQGRTERRKRFNITSGPPSTYAGVGGELRGDDEKAAGLHGEESLVLSRNRWRQRHRHRQISLCNLAHPCCVIRYDHERATFLLRGKESWPGPRSRFAALLAGDLVSSGVLIPAQER